MADEHIAYSNLLLQLVYHYTHAYELSRTLIDLVKFLVIGYEIAKYLLNLEKIFACTQTKYYNYRIIKQRVRKIIIAETLEKIAAKRE